MRFLITATPDPNAPPAQDAGFDAALFAAYMKFNEELQKAGVLVASEGLNPDASGARVGVKDGKRVVLDGPFSESKELVGGFYLIDVQSLDEAVAWALRCPTGFSSDAILTVLPMTSAKDIPADLLRIAREVAPTWAATWQ
jgi:hypothetical protein